MHVVLYEDRASDLIGLKLALASIARYHPDWSASVYLPEAPKSIQTWCTSLTLRSVEVHTCLEKRGWNAKPYCLLSALEAGREQVLWIDSDILFTRSCSSLLDSLPCDAVVAAEEVWWMKDQGSRTRTISWGLSPGIDLKVTVNSCFLRFHRSHIPLLEAWRELLTTPTYLTAQKTEWNCRPLHMGGDQEVLTALLGSKRFSDITVRLLRNGSEIAQCFEADGYSVGARIRNAFRKLPPVLHAQGLPKPWNMWGKRSRPLSEQLSPYSSAASVFAEQFPTEVDWCRTTNPIARLMDVLVFGDPSLRGLFPAAIKSARRLLKRKFGPLH